MPEQSIPCENEEWKPVVGYEGLYEVSCSGRVRRPPELERQPRYNIYPGRILRPYHDERTGYFGLTLTKNKVSRLERPHRLVALAFIGPCPDGQEVNHKNGIKTDNSVSNLEYVTPRENAKHARRMGLFVPAVGENASMARLTTEDVLEIRRRRSCGEQLRSIAKDFGINIPHTCAITKRKRWKHV
jgi:hypothetical protein